MVRLTGRPGRRLRLAAWGRICTNSGAGTEASTSGLSWVRVTWLRKMTCCLQLLLLLLIRLVDS